MEWFQVLTRCDRLIANERTFPFHLHVLRSLLHLLRHTDVYIPLASHIVPIITTILASPSRPKASTLRPLDLEVVIRAPTRYLKTRGYREALTNEAVYLLAEWLSSPGIQASVAFPEIVVGIVVVLRKGLKAGKVAGTSGKEISTVKSLVVKIEESAKWVEGRRQGIAFGPGKYEAVRRWEATMQGRVGDSPLGKYTKVIRTAREKQKALLEKVNARIFFVDIFIRV
jgi:nucleolar complex protein 2